MANKPYHLLSDPDLDLRLGSRVGMEQGVKQVIVRQCGFELYNTRPYHNYETWSDGYIIMGRRDGKAMDFTEAARLITERTDRETYLIVSREDLDEACREFGKTLQPNLDERRLNVKTRRRRKR